MNFKTAFLLEQRKVLHHTPLEGMGPQWAHTVPAGGGPAGWDTFRMGSDKQACFQEVLPSVISTPIPELTLGNCPAPV